MHRVQLRAGGTRRVERRRARPSLRAQDAVALLRVPGMRPHLLGGNTLAANARGAGRALRDILRRLVYGDLSEDEALRELRSLQLEELGGRARLDLGRFMRRGIPEVVLAPGKTPSDAARLVVALAERQGQGLISRMSPAHESAVREQASAAGMDVVIYAASARVLRADFVPEGL